MKLDILTDFDLTVASSFELRELPHRNTLLTTADSSNYMIELSLPKTLAFHRAWQAGDQGVPDGLAKLFTASQQLYDQLCRQYGLLDPANLLGTSEDSPDAKYLLAGSVTLGRCLMNIVGTDNLAVCSRPDDEVLRTARLHDAVPVRFEPQMDELAFGHFEQLARNYRIQWSPLIWRRDSLWLGPMFSTSGGPSWADVQRRRVAAHLNEPIARALQRPSVTGPVMLLSVTAIQRAFQLLPSMEPGIMFEIGLDGSVTEHTVLAWPARLEDRGTAACFVRMRYRSAAPKNLASRGFTHTHHYLSSGYVVHTTSFPMELCIYLRRIFMGRSWSGVFCCSRGGLRALCGQCAGHVAGDARFFQRIGGARDQRS